MSSDENVITLAELPSKKRGCKLRSIDDYSNLVGLIYDAGLDGSLWQSVLHRLIELTDARAGNMVTVDPNSRQLIVRNANVDDDEAKKYNSYYHRLDPVAPLIETATVGTVLTSRVVCPGRNKETEFFQDWAIPNEVSDAVFVSIERQRNQVCALVLARPWLSRPLASARNLHLLKALSPHFRRAIAVAQALADATRQPATSAELLQTHQGCVLLAADGHVLFANETVREMTLANDGLHLAGDGLHARTPRDEALLQELLWLARPRRGAHQRTGGRMNIARRSGCLPLAIQTLPLSSHYLAENFPGCTMVIITDRERSARAAFSALRDVFGLTIAEADLAMRIPGSRSLQATADEMGLSLSTVRTHLQRAFEKTGTHRQAELVQLIGEIDRVVIRPPSRRRELN